MRIPIVGKLVPEPRVAAKGIMRQAVGVIGYAAANKFIPSVWGRWAAYIIMGRFGLWFPITKGVLYVTKLDQKINTL